MIHGDRRPRPSLHRRKLSQRPAAEVLAVYLRKYWAWQKTRRSFPRVPFTLRPGHRVTAARWFDATAEACEIQIAFLAGKRKTPHPREGHGRGALVGDVIEVLIRIDRAERQAAVRRSKRAAPKAKQPGRVGRH